MGNRLNITGGTCTVKGAKERNEDYALVSPPYGACLADGMSGERMGEVVARCACNVAMRTLTNGGSAAESLAQAQSYSRELIKNLNCGRSGAAVTVIRCNDDNAEVAWAGDVLCMHLCARSGRLSTITKPDRGKRGLTNAVGRTSMVVNATSRKLNAGDRLLLCSDGLWETVQNDEIKEILYQAQSPYEAAVLLVMGRSYRDDATATVLFVSGMKCAKATSHRNSTK